jgi:hypothetical protein
MPVKRAVFTTDVLPLITSDSKYYVRYRAVSDDGALTSQWSSFYEMTGNTIQDFTGEDTPADTLSAQVSQDQRYIFLQWDTLGSTILKSSVFDVFSQWSSATIPTWSTSDYEYVATVSSTNFSVPIPTGSTYGKFVVQLATHDKIVNDTTILNLGLGEIALDTIYDAPDLDGGTI